MKGTAKASLCPDGKSCVVLLPPALEVGLLRAEDHSRPPEVALCHGSWDGSFGLDGPPVEAATAEETNHPREVQRQACGGSSAHLAHPPGPLGEKR